MGSCSGIFCNNNIDHVSTNSNKIRTDIIIEKKLDKDFLTKYYSQLALLNRVTFLQKKIKDFLKLNKTKMKIKKSFESNKVNASSKKQKSLNNNTSSDDIKLKKNTMDNTTDDSFKNNKKEKEQKTYEADEEELMKVEQINPQLMNNNLKEAFKKRKTYVENDPRDALHDGVRRYYSKIIEEQSSYEGEWKNGMRDGFGILCWGDESKFIGNFVENEVVGYGKLYHKDGDYYKGMWNNFQANGIGKYRTKHKAYYKGYWLNDKQDKFGMEKWPKGSNFIGDYKNGNKNGIGIID